MKTTELPQSRVDSVIAEVRQAKREILEEHGGDLDSFFAGIRSRQAVNPKLVKTTRGEPQR